MKWNDAIRLLDDCEHGLRKKIAEAVEEGDYAGVHRINDLAKAVAALAAEGRISPAPSPSDAASSGSKADATRNGHESRATTPGGAPAAARLSRIASQTYPRFLRRGDELVKVGWSKKARQEYNHRASRGSIDAVVAAVRQLGARGRLFTGDKLLPLKDPADGARLPDYQAYVALAWLKHLELVQQQGRKSGYTLVPDKQIESTLTAAWPELAEWQW